MRKSRAIFILITTLVVLAGYVAWAAWEPAPTLQAMVFHKNVDADARSAAEAYCRSHPPKARKLTWQRFLNRLIDPYHPREKPPVHVETFLLSDGAKLVIYYPGEVVVFERGRKDGRWHVTYRELAEG